MPAISPAMLDVMPKVDRLQRRRPTRDGRPQFPDPEPKISAPTSVPAEKLAESAVKTRNYVTLNKLGSSNPPIEAQ